MAPHYGPSARALADASRGGPPGLDLRLGAVRRLQRVALSARTCRFATLVAGRPPRADAQPRASTRVGLVGGGRRRVRRRHAHQAAVRRVSACRGRLACSVQEGSLAARFGNAAARRVPRPPSACRGTARRLVGMPRPDRVPARWDPRGRGGQSRPPLPAARSPSIRPRCRCSSASSDGAARRGNRGGSRLMRRQGARGRGVPGGRLRALHAPSQKEPPVHAGPLVFARAAASRDWRSPRSGRECAASPSACWAVVAGLQAVRRRVGGGLRRFTLRDSHAVGWFASPPAEATGASRDFLRIIRGRNRRGAARATVSVVPNDNYFSVQQLPLYAVRDELAAAVHAARGRRAPRLDSWSSRPVTGGRLQRGQEPARDRWAWPRIPAAPRARYPVIAGASAARWLHGHVTARAGFTDPAAAPRRRSPAPRSGHGVGRVGGGGRADVDGLEIRLVLLTPRSHAAAPASGG